MQEGKATKLVRVFASEEEARENVKLNKSKYLLLEGKGICFSHVAQGFFAADDACPHLGDSLSRGTCNYLGEIVCPWHSYRFNLATGEETTGHNLVLRTYPVYVNQKGVFIELPV